MKEVAESEKLKFETYEEFRQWTETQAGYWILIRGVPMPSPSPSRWHQEVSKRLLMMLNETVEKTNLGKVYNAPLDIVFRPNTVYQPDLMVILNDRFDRMTKTHIEGSPNLVMEILSPRTAKLDLIDKRYDYAAAGVSEYWIVDPDSATVDLYALDSGTLSLRHSARKKGTITSILIPTFSVVLEELFRDL